MRPVFNRSSLYVLFSAVIFALGGLFFKLADWTPGAISAGRAILAGLTVFTVLKLTGRKIRFNRTVLLSGITLAGSCTVFTFANKLTTAGNAIVLQYTMPVFVILIMALIYGKKPTGLEIVTCIVVFGGIVFFFIDSLSAGNGTGNLLGVLSGVFYAGYFVLSGNKDADLYSSLLICYAICTLIGLKDLINTDIAGSSSVTLLAVAGLGILQQAFGQILLAEGLKKTPPVTAALLSGLEPILNPIIVAVFYGEKLTPVSLIGACIVLVAITVYNILIAKDTPEA